MSWKPGPQHYNYKELNFSNNLTKVESSPELCWFYEIPISKSNYAMKNFWFPEFENKKDYCFKQLIL